MGQRRSTQAAAARATSYGALYYMAWEPFGTTVASIADGGSDAYVTSFAKAVPRSAARWRSASGTR